MCFDFFGFAILLQKSGNPRWDWVGWGGRYRPDDHVVDTTLSSHVPPTRKRAGKALQGANVQGVGKAL